MKLKQLRQILQPQETMNKVTASSWSTNNYRLAVVTTDRVVHLYDENGDKKDKFSTKAAEKTTKAYVVTSMVFSPDSNRLLVAQSDNIVFVYKLGLEWTDKKSICNKFATTSGVTCAAWPSQLFQDIVFGCADGKVRVGALRTNKAVVLYSGESCATSMASGPDGRSVIVGHVDGTVYRVTLDGVDDGGSTSGAPGTCTRFFSHSCPPYALAWKSSGILAAGSDGRVCFYDDENGSLLRTFDYSDDAGVRDLTCAAFSPSGEAVVVGSYNRFLVFELTTSSSAPSNSNQVNRYGQAPTPIREWRETLNKEVENLYSVTSLVWKSDGSRLMIGNVTGAADLYDACLRRTRYRDKFEFTYVSPSTVIVKRLATGMRIVLRSSFGHEIAGIRVFQDRFLIAHTPATLLVGDLESCKLSEVPWMPLPPQSSSSVTTTTGKSKSSSSPSAATERYYFDNLAVCIVHRAGELSMIEYGRTDILASVRTEYMSRHVVSIRLNERLSTAERERLAKSTAESGIATNHLVGAGGNNNTSHSPDVHNKKLAYLMDAQTIHVIDLVSGILTATVPHDSRIDWIELSGRGNFVLFRDRRHRLYLYDTQRQSKATLLSYCNYAQWVPGSDVVVAQRRNQLCVWYNVRAADKMTTFEIRGDVEDIERTPGKTEVIIDEGLTTSAYLLDETLIGFGTAMDDGDLEAACATLDAMSMNNSSVNSNNNYNTSSSSSTAPGAVELDAMWQQLGQEAMRQGALSVAQRCAAAVGDTSRARFLQRTQKIAKMAAERIGGDGKNFWLVRARLSQLVGDVPSAEGIFLEQGRIDDAIAMHQQLHRYDDAIAVAETHGRREAETMRHQYFQYLMDSGQEEKAGALKEHEGDSLGAISLYLRGGYPAKALSVALAKPVSFPRDVLERITAALATAGMYEKAGSLLESIGDSGRSLEAYVRGNAYRPAVELARRSFPHRVVELEKAWGDWLMSQKQTEAAINHFIEAGAHTQAISAAMSARQYPKAAQLVQDTLPTAEAARPFWRQLAKVHAERGALDEAEKYLVKAGDGRAAVDLYLGAGKYDAAHRVARSCMAEADIVALYVEQARRAEAAGHLRQAEKLYVAVRAYDSAISMYHRAKQHDSVLRLVGQHRPDLLRDTHLHVAEALRSEGSLRAAERHYVEAGQWEAAVTAFKQANLWEDATRVARAHGGQGAAHRVAYAHASALGGEAGMKLLNRLGLMDQAIEYACDSGDWDRAMEMASKQGSGNKEKVHFVHNRRAMKLEDMGQYAAAEQSFVAAEKPREAIEMYMHLKDWGAALRVAEEYDPASVVDILEAQAREAAGMRDLPRAEGLFLDAKRPDLAIEAWFEARQYPDALRVAKQYLPHKVNELTERVKRAMSGGDGGGGSSLSFGAAASPSGDRKGRASSSLGAGAISSPTMGPGGGSNVTTTPSSSSSSSSSSSFSPSSASGGAGGDPLATARMWEGSREYARAVDAYLAVGTNAGYDLNTCSGAWMTSVQIASKHDKGRYRDVAEEVAHRLAEISKLEQAGDLFADIEQIDKAADCYVQCQAWNKAREIVRNAPAKLRDAVEQSFKTYLVKGGDPAQMAAGGAVDAACAVYAAQGQYEKVFELASKANAATLAQYIYPHAEQLLSSGPGKAADVVSLLSKFGAPPVASQFHLYRRLVTDLFSAMNNNTNIKVSFAECRDVLYKLIAGLRKQQPQTSEIAAAIPEFERLLLLIHFASLRLKLADMALPELAARVSVSLLRFVSLGILPADRAFYDAGMACKAANWKPMALVLLNRFIDLSDAIEEGDSKDASGLDNGDFIGSGIPEPADIPLPRTCSIPERIREEAKEWVLTISMDRKVEQTLNKRPCFSCGAQIFEGAINCHSCHASFPSCSITGYPIASAQIVSCGSCSSKFAKPSWNAVVGKTKSCPWCAAGGNTSL